MNYGEIVKAAFWITLRNRILWFFGFFAGGTSAGANFNTPQATSAVSTTRILEIRGRRFRRYATRAGSRPWPMDI
jgi:hypothetical protein